jgi:hypothetical protein
VVVGKAEQASSRFGACVCLFAFLLFDDTVFAAGGMTDRLVLSGLASYQVLPLLLRGMNE